MRSFRSCLILAALIAAGLPAPSARAAAPPASRPAEPRSPAARPPPPPARAAPERTPARPPDAAPPEASVGTRGDAAGEVGGVVEADGARVVVLPEPPRVGETVQTAEGWFRVDEAPDREGGGTGSFAVIRSEPLVEEPAEAGAGAGAAGAGADACAIFAAQAAACEAGRSAGPPPARARTQGRRP